MLRWATALTNGCDKQITALVNRCEVFATGLIDNRAVRPRYNFKVIACPALPATDQTIDSARVHPA